MESRSEDGLVVREEKKGWCLGDWCTTEKVAIPEPFVNTYFLIKNLERMAEMADILGKPSEEYRQKAEMRKKDLIRHYYDEEKNSFCDGIQGADAFAIDIGLGNDKMLQTLVEKYDALGEFDTGIFGTDILIRILFENGYADTALMLLSSDKGASFGSLMRGGETTLCEYWNVSEKSHNHHMFGQVTAYLFRYLLGVRTWGEKLTIKPVSHKTKLSAEGTLDTRFGNITVKRETTEIEDKITVLSEEDAVLVYGTKTHYVSGGEKITFVFANDLGE
jgi:alpha-L-rhamnosidase